MPGGLLNLVSEGNINFILNGNPSKTFFKTTYAKYTNFGMQKFRLNFDGLRTLRITEDSEFVFQIPRHADLLMDTYFVVTLPNIWSPVRELFPPLKTDIVVNSENNGPVIINDPVTRNYWPYEFKWIENLGAQMIRSVRYKIGGQIIQEFTGQYLYNMVQRDFSETKKKLFDEMIGNTKELTDPANYGGRNNVYPNVIYNEEWTDYGGPEPSIRGRKIYVPLNIWSTLSSKLAFPLVSLQYEYLTIEVTCRPVQELFVVRYQPTREIAEQYSELIIRAKNEYVRPDNEWTTVTQAEYFHNTRFIGTYIQPNQISEFYRFYRFIHPPISPLQASDYEMTVPNVNDGTQEDDQIYISDRRLENGTISATEEDRYSSKETIWNSDIHLIATYCFLSEEERRSFAANTQCYLIRQVHETTFYNKTGNNLISLDTNGLVSSWMWFFQRSDVNLRNQWSNYTNWETENIPYKSISNLLYDSRRPDIPASFYSQSTNLFNNFANPASWDNTTLGNFALYFLTGDSQHNDIEAVKKRMDNKEILENIKSDFNYLPKPYLITGPLHVENQIEIMTHWALLLNGTYRENRMDSGVTNYIEKYVRTPGNGKRGLYCYNFGITTDPFQYQPSGAINLSRFNSIQFELSTIFPPQREKVIMNTVIDACGNTIGINKPTWRLFEYNYNLHVMEERYNILSFIAGMASLTFSR